jgi:hypothetical protein
MRGIWNFFHEAMWGYSLKTGEGHPGILSDRREQRRLLLQMEKKRHFSIQARKDEIVLGRQGKEKNYFTLDRWTQFLR